MPALAETRNSPSAAYIGIGSNLHDPAEQVRTAIGALSHLPESRCCATSSLYANPPMGPSDQPHYVNAVARLDTRLEPLALLDHLLAIEQAQGRNRDGQHWGPRVLDLDLLLYGNQVMRHPRLILPHPGAHERAFVLLPLRELDESLEIPGRGRIVELAASCPSSGLERLQEMSP